MPSFEQARKMMVDGQVRPNDVTDLRILEAFGSVPREVFTGAAARELAYLDLDLRVSERAAEPRYLLKPMTLAKLIEAADIGPTDRVLDVGCTTGYSSAILTQLASKVVALESDASLARMAQANLAAVGAANARVVSGEFKEGAREDAPFDVILLNGSVDSTPDLLAAQLAPDGRLLCVVRHGAIGKAMLFRHSAGGMSGIPIFDAAAPLLPGFSKEVAFAF
jgi:protein-L-isoaspartate(D-aspartate) O-methyltransferase